MIINIFMVIVLVLCAGFFDYIMDMIKDYPDNWLSKKCKDTKYELWSQYGSHVSLPFFKTYNPGVIWLSDAWHMAKHFMLLSFSGAITFALGLSWYFIILLWWLVYFVEGKVFNLFYQKLKK